jgi:hypothetical protein
MYDGLPEACLTLLPSNGNLIYIERGQQGYHTSNWDTGDSAQNRCIADEYNQKRGITKAQEEAMLNGSMFGWDVPAADPKRYENHQPEVNAGYAIIKRETVDGIEIVLGESVSKSGMYVTWRRTPANERHGIPEYYWGHYYKGKDAALNDFNSRVEEEKTCSKDDAEDKARPVSKKRDDPER